MAVSCITVRAVHLLRKGPLAEDVLVCHLWPLVDPGIAFRQRQVEADRLFAKNRRLGRKEISRRAPTASEAVEIGARRKTKNMLNNWLKVGIVRRTLIDDQPYLELLREPKGMPKK